ncbi:MAG: antibiotic biosynthesis monooxygenase [Saprospiraceae bacterium]|nr:antibiotic biosynthesis monooxygenase [Saprospiraceae bacterium]
MITRIVKMVFPKENEQDFRSLFSAVKPKIEAFPGCHSVKLMRGVQGETFFTISEWESEDQLNNYRSSSLFKGTWAKTKAMFAERAQAWSTVYCG